MAYPNLTYFNNYVNKRIEDVSPISKVTSTIIIIIKLVFIHLYFRYNKRLQRPHIRVGSCKETSAESHKQTSK